MFLIESSRKTDMYNKALTEYFHCELYGFDACVLELDRRGSEWLNTFAEAIIASFPYIMLIFIIRIDDLKKKWKNVSTRVYIMST